MIADLAKRLNVTSIVITHDMFSVFRIAKNVAMLNEGGLCYYGDAKGLDNSDNPVVVEFLDRYK